MKKYFIDKDIKKYLIVGVILIVFYLGISNLNAVGDFLLGVYSLISPFIIGLVIAFIFNVPMKQIEYKILMKTPLGKEKYVRIRRAVSYIITLLLIICIITIVMFIVVPQLAQTIGQIFREFPTAFNNFTCWLNDMLKSYPDIENRINSVEIDWDSIVKNMADFLSTGTKGIISGSLGAVNGIISGVTSFFIGFVFSVYVLFQKERLSAQIKKVLFAFFSKNTVDKILEIASVTNTTFANFLSGQCLEAVILGSMFFVTMTILRLPYALLIGILISITALIPIVGAFIGLLVGILLIAMVSPIQAVIFIIMFFVLQQLEGNLIYPHVVGNSVGLPGIWVLVAVTIGGKVYGIAGMLTFIPICSVIYSLFGIYVNKRCARNNMNVNKDINL